MRAGFILGLSGARRAFPGRVVNTHPALLPSFPGAHGGARRAGLRRQGHRLHGPPRRRRRRHRPVLAQAHVAVADDDDEDSLHERIKTVERALLVETSCALARPRLDRLRQEGHHPVSTRPRPSRPRLGLRQDRPRGARPRPARRRRRDRLDRLDRRAHRRRGRPGHAGRGAHRLPRVPRRPGQDPAPAVHAGILADLRLDDHVPARGARRRALRARRGQPLPVRRDRGLGRAPDECVEQIDIGGPTMVRAAAKNHPSVAVVTSTRALRRRPRRRSRGRLHPGGAAALAAEAFVHTASYDVAVASWMGNVVAPTDDGTGFPAWVGGTWQRAEVLRYGENPHQPRRSTSRRTRRAGGLARPSSCTARRCRTTTTSTPTPRAGRVRPRRARGRDHQARQPVRHRRRRRHRRGAPQGARDRPGVGLRRRHRRQPPGDRGDGRAGRRGLHRGRRRPGFDDDALGGAAAKKNLRLLVAADGGRTAGSRSGRSAAGCSGSPSTGSTPRATTRRRRRGRSRAAGRRRGDAGRPRLRLARLPRGEVQRDPAGGATARRSASAWARSTGSTRPLAVARAGEERAAGAVAASDAFFPFADGLAGAARRRGARGRAARRLGARRGGHRRGAAAGVTMYLTGTRHFFH
jgi:phosphoribosylaminoimidazolecarboxamide formyltransferase / IMP cyclohydrolase